MHAYYGSVGLYSLCTHSILSIDNYCCFGIFFTFRNEKQKNVHKLNQNKMFCFVLFGSVSGWLFLCHVYIMYILFSLAFLFQPKFFPFQFLFISTIIIVCCSVKKFLVLFHLFSLTGMPIVVACFLVLT